ncbi:hypothetical protein AGMMS50284_2860 [Clostridia bacterium]|nr:hypothetical protein AGMMS50284_2860 [Clostridia bacterium]
MKRTIVFCFVFILFCTFFGMSAAAEAGAVDCTLDIPAEVTINKAFTAVVQISADTPCSLGAILITVSFDNSTVNFSEATLIEKSSAKLTTYENGSTVKLLYLNTAGTALNANAANIINIKFKSLGTACETPVHIASEQAVTSNEQPLFVKNNINYTVKLQEKEVTSTKSASGQRSASTTSVKSSNAQSASKSTSSKSSSLKANQNTEETFYVQNQQANGYINEDNNTLDLTNSSSSFAGNIVLFICGFGAAIAMLIFFLIAYRMGKSKGISKGISNKEQTTDDSKGISDSEQITDEMHTKFDEQSEKAAKDFDE